MTDRSILESFGSVLYDEPMRRHTTYKIGGPADYYIEVDSTADLEGLIQYLNQEKIDWIVLGNGSNVLIADHPFHGAVIHLQGEFTSFSFDGTILRASAGCSLIAMSQEAKNHSLSGLEFASGIPGTLGGGIYMNAGAYLSDLSKILIDVTILDHSGIRTIRTEDLNFTYRHSAFQQHKDWVILSARLQLEPEDRTKIQALMDSRKQRRLSSQPVSKPCAGSVFRNPPGEQAWRIVDDLGFRGRRQGGAKVSEMHSNFIINENGDALATDVDSLIRQIQQAALEKYGISLITEVERINWNGRQKKEKINRPGSETEEVFGSL